MSRKRFMVVSGFLGAGNIIDAEYSSRYDVEVTPLAGTCICYAGEALNERIERLNKIPKDIVMSDIPGCGIGALEPIGIEHTPEELAEHIFFSKELETIQYGAMKRISVPGTLFENTPEITYYTLSKYTAAVVLAMAGMKKFPWIGIHEPTIHGYMSGANLITAETGVNPRDTVTDTLQNRGLDITDCRRILKDAGYKYGAHGDGTRFEL